MKIKKCSQCNIRKPLSEFYKLSCSKDGHRPNCIKCSTKVSLLYRKNNREKILESIQSLKLRKPWYRFFTHAQQRCRRNSWYIQKGIKNLLTREQVKELWIRDKANLLKRPSIDRIDSNGHYSFENCRFIELYLNSTGKLKKDGSLRWSTISDACEKCGTDSKPCHAFSMCRNCYGKIKRGFIPKYPFGVCYDKRRNKYNARLRINKKLISLGSFDSIKEASDSIESFCYKTNFKGRRNGFRLVQQRDADDGAQKENNHE